MESTPHKTESRHTHAAKRVTLCAEQTIRLLNSQATTVRVLSRPTPAPQRVATVKVLAQPRRNKLSSPHCVERMATNTQITNLLNNAPLRAIVSRLEKLLGHIRPELEREWREPRESMLRLRGRRAADVETHRHDETH